MLLPYASAGLSQWTDDLDESARRLDERILPRRWAGRLRRALEAESTAASTSMEGVPITVDDARRILAGDPPAHVSEHDQALVRGYREAMTYVQRRADDGRLRWNRELLVAVQDHVLAGNFGEGAGRLRTGAAWVRTSQTGAVAFEPPDHERVPGLVDDMCEVLEAAEWHPAIGAAWLHVAVAAIHPFKDGNGRTARVLASLAMYRGGFRHPAFTNLEEWWGRHTATYYQAFDCLGPRFDEHTDVTPFIRAHLSAQRDQVRALALRQRTEGLLWTALENLLEDAGLPTRLANALYDSFTGAEVTTPYYCDLIGASIATARNDLQSAASAGLLAPVGRTRGRKWMPGRRLFPMIARVVGNVEADRDAIVNALMTRANDDVDAPVAGPHQDTLPGFGP
jgi:Fic family protein